MNKTFFASLSSEEYMRLWPQYTLELEDVYIGPGGAIYHENGELHSLANFNYSFWRNLSNDKIRPNNPTDSAKYKEKIDLNKFKIKNLTDQHNYIFAHHFHNIYVYGHIWDVFQDLEKIEQLNLDNTKLIVPQLTNHVYNLELHLDLFGYKKQDLISLDLPGYKPCNTLYKIPKLYYPSPSVSPCQVSNTGLKYLRSKYFKLLDSTPRTTKLYLQRPKGNREASNSEETYTTLKEKGFIALDGTEGIKKHVNLFKNASIIIGAHGSLFKNIIFSDQNPVIYEFCPLNREDHNFEGMGKTMGLDYNWIGCEADSNYNIQIDLSLIKHL